MPTVITHAFVGAALGTAAAPSKMTRRFVAASVVCSVLPDLDVIGFRLGVEYGDLLGHRGLSHSLFFALIVSSIAGLLVLGRKADFGKHWWRLWLCLFLIMGLHSFLDATTAGGLGVAFFSPFRATRYFMAWRPIQVAPIGIAPIFTPAGARMMACELVYVWIPTIVIAAAILIVRKKVKAAD